LIWFNDRCDAAGNLTSTSDPSASYTFAYDNLNRPTSVTTALPGVEPSVTLLSQYDNSGNRTQLAASLNRFSAPVIDPTNPAGAIATSAYTPRAGAH
jgi:YD repeat-containing protein